MCVSTHHSAVSGLVDCCLCLRVNVHSGAVHPEPGHMEHPCRAFSSHGNDAGGHQSHAEVMYTEVRDTPEQLPSRPLTARGTFLQSAETLLTSRVTQESVANPGFVTAKTLPNPTYKNELKTYENICM